MYAICRAALSALSAIVLVGCAATPLTQPLHRKVATATDSVDVKLGIRQPELYGNFERSTQGARAANACAAVPGIGLLLAMACGAGGATVDTAVNTSRAKAADESIRPLKDEIVDFKFDQAMNEAVTKALQGVSDLRVSGVQVTRDVDNKSYETVFKDSKAGAVMFVNIDYHLSVDLSTLQVSARALLYPRNAASRAAAGLPAELSGGPNQPEMMNAKNAAYRSLVVYRAQLPKPKGDDTEPADYIAAWKADSGKLLRTSLQEGVAHVSRLLAEDLQRAPDAVARPSLRKEDVENKQQADVVAESPAGRVLVYPNGTVHFRATPALTALAAPPATPAPATTAAK